MVKSKNSNNKKATSHAKSKKSKKECLLKTLDPWMISTIVLGAMLILAFLTSGFGMWNSSDDAMKEDATGVDSDLLTMYVVNDERCDVCQGQAQQLIANLQQMFPEVAVEKVEYTSKEGKEFYDEYNLGYLPAILFSPGINETENYGQIGQYLKDSNELSILAISGVSHDPEAEICTNGEDDNGNGDVDCEDASCSGAWECMEKVAVPKVELFVWSFCPGGISGENTLFPAVDLLGDKIDSKVVFIGPVTEDKQEAASSCFAGRGKSTDEAIEACCKTYDYEGKTIYSCALHNQPGNHEESIESLRQACIMDRYDTKSFWTYLNKYNSECLALRTNEAAYSDCIESAMSSANVELSKVEECMEGDGLGLLIEDSKRSDELDIHSSPSLFVNNKAFDGSRTPDGWKNGICSTFEDRPSECGEEVVAAQADPNSGASC